MIFKKFYNMVDHLEVLINNLERQIDFFKTEPMNKIITKHLNERWEISFNMPNGAENLALVNNYKSIPVLIDCIKKNGGTNIVIVDKTYKIQQEELANTELTQSGGLDSAL